MIIYCPHCQKYVNSTGIHNPDTRFHVAEGVFKVLPTKQYNCPLCGILLKNEALGEEKEEENDRD